MTFGTGRLSDIWQLAHLRGKVVPGVVGPRKGPWAAAVPALEGEDEVRSQSIILPKTMATQISYFSPGPAKLPDAVLKDLQKELVRHGDCNISVLELSHRSKEFNDIIERAKATAKRILNVPDNYKIMFMHGGGTGQFAAVAMNLLGRTGEADYVVTGSWSQKSAKEASKYGKVNYVLPSADQFSGIPSVDTWKLSPRASYVYYCSNETVEGVEFQDVPELPYPDVPLVCDMSSNIASRHFDVSKFGLIYAGAQKNIGSSGVTLVIIRDDLIGHQLPICPIVLDYSVTAKNNSLYNTPPTYSIYVVGEVLKWVEKEGGVEEMERRAVEKSSLIYNIVDSSNNFYVSGVSPGARSRMNATFRVGGREGNDDLEKKFLSMAAEEGLLSLKGHRSVGGIRVSLYNAITVNDATRLANFMKKFMKDHANTL
ncbi:phosphoserine aminotransferase [Oratosquilla oratoria]|uniref:phosphoserine aminotransferase n=1 Tax=Oratosquilla oratoria TaxID=337810 RepID=UPI003F76D5D0